MWSNRVCTKVKRFNSRNILNLTEIYYALIAYVNMDATHFESKHRIQLPKWTNLHFNISIWKLKITKYYI